MCGTGPTEPVGEALCKIGTCRVVVWLVVEPNGSSRLKNWIPDFGVLLGRYHIAAFLVALIKVNSYYQYSVYACHKLVFGPLLVTNPHLLLSPFMN